MQVIPNGFNIDQFSGNRSSSLRFRSQLNIPAETMVFISVGRYSPVKDHKTFVNAALELLKENADVHFLMVGRGLIRENEEIMSVISRSGGERNFHLLGERKDIPVCLAAADVFCLHSLTEGFPNVLGEAMLSGLPCATTDVGDAAYLLGNDRFTVEPGNAKALAEKMSEFVEMTAGQRTNIGRNNRNRVIERFSMAAVSGKYKHLYQELCHT